jgi:hypothetical protein
MSDFQYHASGEPKSNFCVNLQPVELIGLKKKHCLKQRETAQMDGFADLAPMAYPQEKTNTKIQGFLL